MAQKKLTQANNPLISGPALEDRQRGAGIPYREIKISAIERDANQPRTNFDQEKLQELAKSIKTYGILSPLLVRPAKVPGRFLLIAGERRLRAAHMAGLSSVPALVDNSSGGESDRVLSMQLVENLQRADLSPLERAHAIGALRDTYRLSVREIGSRIGISKSMVQRSLDILELPDDLLNALREGASESKILLLAKIDNEEVRASYLKDLDVLTRDRISKDVAGGKKDSGQHASAESSPEDQRVVDEIQRALGLKVKMVRNSAKPQSGRLMIDFYSDEDLQEIFRKLVTDSEVK